VKARTEEALFAAIGDALKSVTAADADQQAIRALFKKAFPSSEGYEVVEASSGFEAGLLVRKTFPDVIFLDMVLGDIDERKVCRLIRKNPANAKTKIVTISGAICDEEVHKLKEQGFDDYLKKPFTMEELRKCVAGKRSETIHSSTSRSVLNQQAKKPIS
jgi:CheY-like chemotaxis protein